MLGILSGSLMVIVVQLGCTSTPPPSPPPPPPVVLLASCEATGTIVHWLESGQHKARVYGDVASSTEAKNLYLDDSVLTPGQSGICWNFVSLDSGGTAQLQWVHVKDFTPAGILGGSGQFDPNSHRKLRLVYARRPMSSEIGQIEYPLGSGQKIEGVRLKYDVWIKLVGSTQPFKADPEIVIKTR